MLKRSLLALSIVAILSGCSLDGDDGAQQRQGDSAGYKCGKVPYKDQGRQGDREDDHKYAHDQTRRKVGQKAIGSKLLA